MSREQPTSGAPADRAERNQFKLALQEGRRQVGFWLASGSGTVAEIAGGAGLDWVVIDGEHGPNNVCSILDQLRALAALPVSPVVRAPWNDPVAIKPLLDVGARNILVPFVNSAVEARSAVAAVRYPPHGIRGLSMAQRANQYGRNGNYWLNANDDICLIVQIETRQAVEAVDEIAAVNGVDALFVGPADLGADLGHLGNPAHRDVALLVKDVASRCRAAGKAVGTLVRTIDEAHQLFGQGLCFEAVGSDVGVLRAATDAIKANLWEESA
jgi:2-keto-3-deoxy-L-rhamnonate aldolase RhmA